MNKITVCPECHGNCFVEIPQYSLIIGHYLVKNKECELCEGWGFVDCQDKETCNKNCHIKERGKCENF